MVKACSRPRTREGRRKPKWEENPLAERPCRFESGPGYQSDGDVGRGPHPDAHHFNNISRNSSEPMTSRIEPRSAKALFCSENVPATCAPILSKSRLRSRAAMFGYVTVRTTSGSVGERGVAAKTL